VGDGYGGAGRGLSPRGRRSHSTLISGDYSLGSISAWAEEPARPYHGEKRLGVYLRVGGGAIQTAINTGFGEGLSPRGRRSRVLVDVGGGTMGSISAWAEEP